MNPFLLSVLNYQFTKLEQCRSADALFLDIGNIQAGQFNNYTVIALLANNRLGYSQWIYAVVNDRHHSIDDFPFLTFFNTG